jgi:outer membrane protein assembly factor BamB
MRVRVCLLSALALLALAGEARAEWPTYHADSPRSGVDQSTGAATPFAAGWTSPDLGGNIYAEPLVHGGLVYVATEGNDLFALSEAGGQVVWHQNAGTPVASSALPCGNISPTVGITSTPVIDAAANLIFVVADTWDGSNAHHVMVAYKASDGTPVFSQNVDPPGAIPKNQLQRPGLALSGGRVLIGFGGNDGDCGSYWGWLVSASESGPAAPLVWKVRASNGAGIWQGGGAPAVDAAGSVYVATGNTTGSAPSTYDDSDSILRLTPQVSVQDYFAPSTWSQDDGTDTDLGSAAPQLVDGGLIFQAGKNGQGYLVNSAAMGHELNPPAYQANACRSFGADAYSPGSVFVTCTDGVRAFSLSTAPAGFAQRWRGPSDANGPPIISAGLVWVAAYNSSKLYGLDPATGAVRVTQSTPSMNGVHFVTPAASDGRLFLATGHTVEQYSIGVALSPPPSPPPMPQPPPPPKPVSGCVRLTITVRHPHRARVTRATVFLGRKRLGSFKGHNLRHLHVNAPAGRYTLRLVELTSRHHRLTYRLRFAACRRVP